MRVYLDAVRYTLIALFHALPGAADGKCGLGLTLLPYEVADYERGKCHAENGGDVCKGAVHSLCGG